MKIKIGLLTILSIFTFALYGQVEIDQLDDEKSPIVRLKIESDNIDELKEINWNEIKDLLILNDENQEVAIAIAYELNSENEDSVNCKTKYELEVTGKTTDLDILIARLKNSIEDLE